MVSQAWAVTVVERYVAEQTKCGAATLVVTDVRPHQLGWLITSQGERYLRSRRISDMVIGHGPFLVDGMDGSLHMVHATADPERGEWIVEYREQVRGAERVDQLRARIAELLERDRRLDALRVVRAQAPDLTLRGAAEYVEAVAAGAPVPEHVRPLLQPPTGGFSSYWTLSGPNPEPVG
ncbi:YrhB domain-containing protein [Nocardia carnea]|uniref:YrhB domain-containing protein n=1 Tax=Nocardia carnea TaxID=37328 RepID=UPI0024542758|nr:YrhB domain-containing protein [Nocardia carnea]